jgi:hypothetical protein
MEPPPSLPAVRIRRLWTLPVFPLLALLLSGCSPKILDVVTLRPNGLIPDLFAYWPMDEGSGTVVYDKGPQGRHGTLAGTATWTTHDGFGGALHFEAPTDEMTVMNFPQAQPDWSVSLWVKLPPQEAFNNDTYLTLISTEVPKGGNGPNSGGGWEMNLGRTMTTTAGVTTTSYKYQFAYWVGPDVGKYMLIESPNAPVNEWTHLVAVVDSSAKTLSMYKNGILLMPPAQVTETIKPTGNTTLFMGAWFTPQSRRFTGDLDDVAIYNRVLTPSEVDALHNGPIPPEYLMPGMDGGQGGSQP